MWTKIADIIVKIVLVIWLIGSLILIWNSADNIYGFGYIEEGKIILTAVISYMVLAIWGIAIAAFVEVTIEISKDTKMIRSYLFNMESEVKRITKEIKNSNSNHIDSTLNESVKTVSKIRDTEYLYQEEQTTWKCKYCGFINENTYKFCMECGMSKKI